MGVAPALCFGANHYVRQGASGNGSGSDWANACPSFSGSCAVGSLVRGDTYYIAAGSYSVSSWNRANNGTQDITIKRATTADHGTDTGWNNSFDGQVNWTSRWTFSTGFWNFDGVTGKGVPLSQAVPYGFRIADNASGGRGLVEIDSGDNITIGYTDIDGVSCCHGSFTGPYGVHGNGAGANFRLHHAAVHNTKSDPIHLNSPGPNVILEHNYIARNEGLLSSNHGQGIWMQGYQGAEIRYNFLEDIVGTAYTFCGSGSVDQPCRDVRWYGNVLYHTRTHPQSSNGNQSGDEATYIWECTDSNICPGFLIYNNTIAGFDDWNSGTYPGTYGGSSAAMNNLWYNISNSGLDLHITQDYNSFLNVSGGGPSATHNENVSSAANPFVNIADRDFRLVRPMTAGTTLPAPYNQDPDGKPRGADGTWDRGAFEFGGNVVRPNPPANLQITGVQ